MRLGGLVVGREKLGCDLGRSGLGVVSGHQDLLSGIFDCAFGFAMIADRQTMQKEDRKSR